MMVSIGAQAPRASGYGEDGDEDAFTAEMAGCTGDTATMSDGYEICVDEGDDHDRAEGYDEGEIVSGDLVGGQVGARAPG